MAATGLAVILTGSRWPDLAVGALLAAVFLRSSWQIAWQARAELAEERARRDELTDFNRAASQL